MGDVRDEPARAGDVPRHARWVRISHWILTASLLTLAFTGFVILMAHPRLYWGEVGNDLTPALLELPISRNYQHGGWEKPMPFFQDTTGPTSASRTYDIFNENGWGRSLHFLAAWCLVVPGVVYLLSGMSGGHFRSHIWPHAKELAPPHVWRDVVDHLRFRIPPASGGPSAPEVRVLICGLCRGAADGGDRPGDVASRDRDVSVAGAPVRRLPVRPHGPFRCFRCAPAVRARACRDGHQVRIQTADPGDDRGRLT